jgi:hypothetical protein
MTFDTTKLGGGLLAAGPILMNFVSDKKVWWLGLIFTVVGPFLMSVRKPHKT